MNEDKKHAELVELDNGFEDSESVVAHPAELVLGVGMLVVCAVGFWLLYEPLIRVMWSRVTGMS